MKISKKANQGSLNRRTFLNLILVFLVFASTQIYSQQGNIDPQGKWFFGAELGTNAIRFSENDHTKFQGGIAVEYYFARHWSLSSKIKYFETGISFFRPATGGTGGYFLSFAGTPAYSGTFKGAVVAIPFDIKWEFRVFKNLGASVKLGYCYNIETKSEYSNYSSNLEKDYPKSYDSLNAGFGFNYFVNNNAALYLDVDSFNGGSKGTIPGFLWPTDYIVQNTLVSVGFKYCFKKQ